MKRIITTIAMAAIAAFVTTVVAAQTPETTTAVTTSELKVKITGIRENTGTVMVALGDYKDLTNMVGEMVPASTANEGTAECILSGDIDLGATLYAFLDSNRNFNLDLNERGIPAEGCAFGPVVLDENGTATIELKYYN